MIPTENDLRVIVDEALGVSLIPARRFPIGLCHYVYDATLSDGQNVVLRVTKRENLHYFVGAMHWSGLLRSMRIPLPNVYAFEFASSRTPYPYMILERLPGTDLGEVYASLSCQQKKSLAIELASVQERVGSLPLGAGYGFQSDPAVPPRNETWIQAVEAGIARSLKWIDAAKIVDRRLAFRVRQALEMFRTYLESIPPQPFLEDITTKNVLIHDGRFSGVVDIDEICYGDRVAHLGLTSMALLSLRYSTDYIDYWCEAFQLTEPQRKALDFYTAEKCLCFLGELGQAFNENGSGQIDQERVKQLEAILDRLLDNVLGDQ